MVELEVGSIPKVRVRVRVPATNDIWYEVGGVNKYLVRSLEPNFDHYVDIVEAVRHERLFNYMITDEFQSIFGVGKSRIKSQIHVACHTSMTPLTENEPLLCIAYDR